MGDLLVALGGDLMLADTGGTARAPWHHVIAFVQPAVLPALLQECPDHVIILIGEGEVRAAQLRQTQVSHHLLDGAGEWTFRSRHGDDLGGVLHQLSRQVIQHLSVVPIHPVSQADGLLGLDSGIAQTRSLHLSTNFARP